MTRYARTCYVVTFYTMLFQVNSNVMQSSNILNRTRRQVNQDIKKN